MTKGLSVSIQSQNQNQVQIKIADFTEPKDANALVHLMDNYAKDPMGGGSGLSEDVKTNLPSKLANIPHAFSIICYVNHKAAGLINCFDGFSTFSCKPLVNIHDVIVLKEFRGFGLSQSMLQKVEAHAREKGCSKLTLEVLQGNTLAQQAYSKYGFAGYELDPAMGQAVFWQKALL